jgi:hypothetical protein
MVFVMAAGTCRAWVTDARRSGNFSLQRLRASAQRLKSPGPQVLERPVARLFNAYIVVDWSAASKAGTGADSVLIGVLKRDVRFRLAFEAHQPTTRAEAEKKLDALLQDLGKRGEKALLALEFPLGFPHGLAAGLKLPGEAPWRAVLDQVAKMVKDKADNTNNRFSVGSEINRRLTGGPFPFWGCPPRDTLTTLQPKRQREHGDGDVPEFRQVDLAHKGSSPWKLYYAGAVGGHAILGIPMVRRLKDARGDRLKVWPFETGLRALAPADLENVDVVAAELHPSAIGAAPAPGETKDVARIRGAAERLAKLDETGRLGAAFAAPKDLAADAAQVAAEEEGWALKS